MRTTEQYLSELTRLYNYHKQDNPDISLHEFQEKIHKRFIRVERKASYQNALKRFLSNMRKLQSWENLGRKKP